MIAAYRDGVAARSAVFALLGLRLVAGVQCLASIVDLICLTWDIGYGVTHTRFVAYESHDSHSAMTAGVV
jgi:hypothetical protein